MDVNMEKLLKYEDFILETVNNCDKLYFKNREDDKIYFIDLPTQKEIVEIIKNHPLVSFKGKVEDAYIVGSFAKGYATDRSDIDLVLKIKPKENYTADEFTMFQRRKIMKYFMDNNIRDIRDDLHPQYKGRRIDIYFVYDTPPSETSIKLSKF